MKSTDPELIELFQEELRRTRDPEAAIHAVRLKVEEEVLADVRRRAWGDGGRRGPAPTVGFITEDRFDRICEVTSDVFGVTPAELRQDARRHCLHARWVVAAILRCYRMSYPQVARALRMRDHTRAIEGVRKVDASPELAAARDRVVAALRARGWPLPSWVPGACAETSPPGELGIVVPLRKEAVA